MASATRRSASPAKITLRSFRDGDEAAIAQLFTAYMADFVGPSPVTPQSWRRHHRRQTWTGPSVEHDPDCARLALLKGRVVGYAVTDYKPDFQDDNAAVQELCVERGPIADAIAQALLLDAERRARTRGKQAILLSLSTDDAIVTRAAQALGFRTAGGGAVFMVAVTDLPRFLKEVEPELTRRVSSSEFAQWAGVIAIESGKMASALKLNEGRVGVARARGGEDIRVMVHPDALPPLLLGQLAVGEAFLQNQLTLTASDRVQALTLLDALFPRTPLYLPRAQWW